MTPPNQTPTPFQRSLLAYSVGGMWALTALSFAMLFGVLGIAYRQANAPRPTTAKLEGPLRAARVTDRSLDLWLQGHNERFRVHSIGWYPGLRRAFEGGVAQGSALVLDVDTEELRTKPRPPIDGIPTVRTLGVSVAGKRMLTPDDVERAENSDRRVLPYLVGGLGLLALMMLFLALQRAKLAGREADISRAAPQTTWGSLAGRRAPFTLHARFGRSEKWLLAFVALITLPFAVFMGLQGARGLEEAHARDEIWRTGIPAPARVLTSSVKHNRGFNTVRLKLVVQLADGEQWATSEYSLLFTEPSIPKLTEVRYPPPARVERAVTREAHEARRHAWGFAASMLALGLGLALFLAWEVVSTRRKLDDVRDLARGGRIVHADIVSLERTQGQHAQVILTYRLPRGRKVKETFRIHQAPLVDANRAVVLCSEDEQTSRALRDDGYPLALSKDERDQR